MSASVKRRCYNVLQFSCFVIFILYHTLRFNRKRDVVNFNRKRDVVNFVKLTLQFLYINFLKYGCPIRKILLNVVY